MGDHLAVQGSAHVVRFENAIPVSRVSDSPRYVRVKTLGESTTQRLVSELDSNPNVLEDCLEEIERLKEEDGPSDVPSPSGSGC